MLIAFVASSILAFVLIRFLLFPMLLIADLVFCILADVAVSKDHHYEYPLSIRLLK